jgi:hypothetical protein
MHQAMLDGSLKHFEKLRMAFTRMFQSGLNGRIQRFAYAEIVSVHFSSRGPVEWAVRRQTTADWIDSESKKLIEGRLERVKTKRAAPQKVPVERFHVAQIENKAMAFGDWAIVKSFSADEGKDLICARARL